MNDYKDIESARLDDIRDHMTFGWWLAPWDPSDISIWLPICIMTALLFEGLIFLFAAEVPPLALLLIRLLLNCLHQKGLQPR